LERDREAEKGSVPSVSLEVSAAEKMEDAERVDDAAERSDGHLRCVIWRVGEKTRGGRLSSFCLRAAAIEPLCRFWSRLMAVSNDGKGWVWLIIALVMLRRKPRTDTKCLVIRKIRFGLNRLGLLTAKELVVTPTRVGRGQTC
jgi:hypothetical protein